MEYDNKKKKRLKPLEKEAISSGGMEDSLGSPSYEVLTTQVGYGPKKKKKKKKKLSLNKCGLQSLSKSLKAPNKKG